MGIVRTGKTLEPAVLERMATLAKMAACTPAIVLNRQGPASRTAAETAELSFRRELNEAAYAIGLPDQGKHEGEQIDYGVDYKTGELLAWDRQL